MTSWNFCALLRHLKFHLTPNSSSWGRNPRNKFPGYIIFYFQLIHTTAHLIVSRGSFLKIFLFLGNILRETFHKYTILSISVWNFSGLHEPYQTIQHDSGLHILKISHISTLFPAFTFFPRFLSHF